MKKLEFSIERYEIPKQESKITNERQEILKMFLDRLNIGRGEGSKYPLLAPGRIAKKFKEAGLKTNGELRQFYGSCNDSKNFSAYFWWSLDKKNYPNIMNEEEEIMDELRSFYRQKRYFELRDFFWKNAFKLSKENRLKIIKVLKSLPDTTDTEKYLAHVAEVLGGKIID